MSPNVILDSASKALQKSDLFALLIKSTVFGAIISGVSCSWGMTTEGGAKGVGESTTSAVVISLGKYKTWSYNHMLSSSSFYSLPLAWAFSFSFTTVLTLHCFTETISSFPTSGYLHCRLFLIFRYLSGSFKRIHQSLHGVIYFIPCNTHNKTTTTKQLSFQNHFENISSTFDFTDFIPLMTGLLLATLLYKASSSSSSSGLDD